MLCQDLNVVSKKNHTGQLYNTHNNGHNIVTTIQAKCQLEFLGIKLLRTDIRNSWKVMLKCRLRPQANKYLGSKSSQQNAKPLGIVALPELLSHFSNGSWAGSWPPGIVGNSIQMDRSIRDWIATCFTSCLFVCAPVLSTGQGGPYTLYSLKVPTLQNVQHSTTVSCSAC